METNVYLLFQWTSEREAKNHIGIYSTLEKARQAAQMDCDQDARRLGHPTEALDWEGTVYGSNAAMASWRDDEDDGLYEIESTSLDVFLDDSEVYGPDGYHPERRKEVHL